MAMFEWSVGSFLIGTMTLDETTLRYQQGLRRVAIALDDIHGFAVRVGVRTRGTSTGAIVIQHEHEGRLKTTSIPHDAEQPASLLAVEALGQRLAHADLTAIPWEDAAQRLGVRARPIAETALRGLLGIKAAVRLACLLAFAALVVHSVELGSNLSLWLGLGLAAIASYAYLRRRAARRESEFRAAVDGIGRPRPLRQP